MPIPWRKIRAEQYWVKIFTSGFDEEPCFFTMELVEGATLDTVCDRLQSRSTSAAVIDLDAWSESLSTACEESRRAEKALSDSGSSSRQVGLPVGVRQSRPPLAQPSADQSYVLQIVELMRQVALAAHALHQAGVVHRDIKPGNVMVTADGSQGVLMDLGLAHLADEAEGRLTRTRQFVGTLRYAMSQVLSTVISPSPGRWSKSRFSGVGVRDPLSIRSSDLDRHPFIESQPPFSPCFPGSPWGALEKLWVRA